MNKSDIKFYFFIVLAFIFLFVIYLIKENFSNPKLVNVIFIIPFLFILTPYFIYELFQKFIITKKIEAVPRFLRDVVDSSLSGFDIISSIKQTKKNDYGYLQKDVRKFSNLLSWGINFNESLKKFSHLIKNDVFIRDVELIIRTREIGANIIKCFKRNSRKNRKRCFKKKSLKIFIIFKYNYKLYILYFIFSNNDNYF